jgi:holo-[acyl-carrier protein] synthase
MSSGRELRGHDLPGGTALATRIGIDLVDVEEIRRAIAGHGDRYLRRIYTDRELADSNARPRQLAACFAAKEATMKALGRRDEALAWQSIELTIAAPHGSPSLRFSGGAAALALELGISCAHVSITHQIDYAAAIVTTKGSR